MVDSENQFYVFLIFVLGLPKAFMYDPERVNSPERAILRSDMNAEGMLLIQDKTDQSKAF